MLIDRFLSALIALRLISDLSLETGAIASAAEPWRGEIIVINWAQLDLQQYMKCLLGYFGFYKSLLAEPSNQSAAMTPGTGRPGSRIVPILTASA